MGHAEGAGPQKVEGSEFEFGIATNASEIGWYASCPHDERTIPRLGVKARRPSLPALFLHRAQVLVMYLCSQGRRKSVNKSSAAWGGRWSVGFMFVAVTRKGLAICALPGI